MPALNVVALISGGKDSLFSILHCLANGHQVAALANLHPQQSDIHDLDSFMYQTVGHNVIDLIAKALELPLYRQPIVGSALSTSRTYDNISNHEGSRPDEVESMFSLLSRVKEAQPEVDAVSTGAILSDYQRTRVESVAIRLGLTPLSYLWQFPFLPPYSEASLLRDMSSVEQDSRIIKVASGALDDSFLWQNVANPRTITRLQRSAERFGVNGDGSTIGEGGEYETLAIDGPAPLWKHRIIVHEDDQTIVGGDAGTATLEIRKATLAAKTSHHSTDATEVRQPPLLDDAFQVLQEELILPSTNKLLTDDLPEASEAIQLPINAIQGGHVIKVDNVMSPGLSASEQTKGIMSKFTREHGTLSQSIIHTSILLRNMEDFQSVNAVYGPFFQKPNPPSRVTISCGERLPEDVLVAISFTCAKDTLAEDIHGLHVQSRSYWAPANIGPYSQAISIPHSITTTESRHQQPRLVHIAGQIPLVPSSMEMISQPADPDNGASVAECVLSLQHLWRIGTVMNVNLWLGAVVFLGRTANDIPRERYLHAARQAWKRAHSHGSAVPKDDSDASDDEVDVWDRKYGRAGVSEPPQSASTYRSTITNECVPPLFVAEVQTLPRNAPVEWSSTGWTDDQSTFHVLISARRDASETLLAGWLALSSVAEVEPILQAAQIPGEALCTVYTTSILPSVLVDKLQPQVIPCFRLWDEDGHRLAAVVSYMMA
ncbi:hypothetical protein K461DRAFT_325477 [Myriangium duriaei CBS 260.36]|uniref:Diphthine--ammonia ligase n=1 Tax=Myriangium duriaei CBS 260.36 TaxID=1168546 RepID=A0A9P4J833_9PEZI|nr:hypothetical protein K461DRAFT_325477 [Myriangium duriaei CBS 260.36]